MEIITETKKKKTVSHENKETEDKRIFLMMQKAPIVYYILNSDTDYIGAMHCGIPSIMHTDCIASAENMTSLLHQLQELKDGKWYVESDWVGSDGKYRHEEYPIHQGLHRLDGYIKEVCDIRKEEKSYLRNFEICFISDLWVKHTDNQMLRVSWFHKNMLLEVDKYIRENHLKIKSREQIIK